MKACPVCGHALEGPNHFCPACHISRPDAGGEAPREADANGTPPPPPAVPVRERPALWLCLLLDAIGVATYFIPGLGESADIAWAPIAGLLFYFLFKGTPGIPSGWGAAFAFTEELLPFTDFIPTFTIAWWLAGRKTRAERDVKR